MSIQESHEQRALPMYVTLCNAPRPTTRPNCLRRAGPFVYETPTVSGRDYLTVPNDRQGNCSSARRNACVVEVPLPEAEAVRGVLLRVTTSLRAGVAALDKPYGGVFAFVERGGQAVPGTRVGFSDGARARA